ncbi:unnamed protein product [Cylindrotheca closterium]|uniref:Uncharacterized protein n=1 Tax=Cylindrotheca closterium TaxID=2856 RepID=A0AAD2JMA0_9STRA|nr:unnamed protein product [Cylindrotheca closterium]
MFRQSTSRTVFQSLGMSLLLFCGSLSSSSLLFFHKNNVFASAAGASGTQKFKRDIGDDCSDLTSEACIREIITIQKCPIACSELLEEPGTIARTSDSEIYQQRVTKQDGKQITLEEYEGYITLFVVIPLVPNAQYYYELVEHVHEIFPFTVEIMILPISVVDDNEYDAAEIIPQANSKVTFLKHEERTDFMIYLSESEVFGGEDNLREFANDRASIYIISSNGQFVERMVAPKLIDLEKRIIVYLQQLDPTFLEL